MSAARQTSFHVEHGTVRRFKTFKPCQSWRRDSRGCALKVTSLAFFFAERGSGAGGFFARDRVRIARELNGHKSARAVVLNCVIRLKCPLDMTITPAVRARMDAEGFSPCYNPAGISPFAGAEFERVTGWAVNDWTDVQMALDNAEVVDALRGEFDGVILHESSAGVYGVRCFAVFDAGQIEIERKSA